MEKERWMAARERYDRAKRAYDDALEAFRERAPYEYHVRHDSEYPMDRRRATRMEMQDWSVSRTWKELVEAMTGLTHTREGE